MSKQTFLLKKQLNRLRAVISLRKAQPVQDVDSALTDFGMQIAKQYAKQWLDGSRNLDTERLYPELGGYFQDIRHSAEFAREQLEW